MDWRRALREVRRIERLIWQLPARPSDEALRAGLARAPGPEPGPLRAWWFGRGSELEHRPYGIACRMRRPRLKTSHPVTFLCVALPDGDVVATIERRCAEVAPVLARFAVDRLFRAQRWRFPDDLDREAPAAAVWDLCWGERPTLLLESGLPVIGPLTGANDAITVSGRWASTGAPARAKLRWTLERLWLEVDT